MGVPGSFIPICMAFTLCRPRADRPSVTPSYGVHHLILYDNVDGTYYGKSDCYNTAKAHTTHIRVPGGTCALQSMSLNRAHVAEGRAPFLRSEGASASHALVPLSQVAVSSKLNGLRIEFEPVRRLTNYAGF